VGACWAWDDAVTETLQNVLVTSIAIAALAWLVANRIRRHRKGASCDGGELARNLRESSSRPAPGPPPRKTG